MMAMLGFFEQSDVENAVQKAKFIVDKELMAPVDFNPSTITMTTRKGNGDSDDEDSDSVRPAETVATGKEPTKEKEFKERSKPTDNEVTVSMNLVFDMLGKWDQLLGTGFAEDVGASVVSTVTKGQVKAAVKSGWSNFKSGWNGGVGSGLKNTAKGAFNNTIGKNLSYLTGSAYEERLKSLNLFAETSSYFVLENVYKQQRSVIFSWGPMQFQGKFTQFSAVYSVFSKAGSPLRAAVNVSLKLDTEAVTGEINSTGVSINFVDNAYKEYDWVKEKKEHAISSIKDIFKSAKDEVKGGGGE